MEQEENIDTQERYREYPICRTCLNVIKSRSYRLQENSGCGEGLKISHVLRFIVPELYLGLSNSPEICGNCRESLRVAYTFRKLCLETETMIGNYLKNVRCTAQVIDLGSVINYLSNRKAHQASQKVSSDLDEDSSDGALLKEYSTKKKIPISNLETLKSAVATVKQLTQQSTPVAPLIHVAEKKPPENEKKVNVKCQPDKKSVVETHHFKDREILNYDSPSGHYINESGKRFIIEGGKAIRVNENAKINNEKSIPGEKKKKPDESIAEAQLKPVKQSSVFKVQFEAMPASNLNPVLRVCEETGLLRNQNNEYFNLDGTPLAKEQVEDEKNKARIRGENLFTISNICTVSDDDFEPIKKPETDQESKIPVNLIHKDEENNKVVEISGKPAPGLTTNSSKEFVGSIFVKKTSDLQEPKDNTKTYEYLKTYRRILPKGLKQPDLTSKISRSHSNEDISSDLTEPDEDEALNPVTIASSDAQNVNKSDFQPISIQTSNSGINSPKPPLIMKPQTNILNFLMNKNLRVPENPPVFRMTTKKVITTSPQIQMKPKSPKKDINPYFPTPTFDTLASENDDGLIKVKEEPPSYDLEDSLPTVDSEDTLSGPDMGETDVWQNIINSLEDTSSNYVDVPEFVKINNVTLTELQELNKKSGSELSKTNANKNLIGNNSLNKKDKQNAVMKLDSENYDAVLKPISKENDKALWDSLPKKFPYNGKMLIKCGSYYKFEDSFTKTNKQAPKRRRLKIVPVEGRERIQGKTQIKTWKLTERDVCVLFTNYTKDGSYVNDHDYLVAPYIRNKILTTEGDKVFCLCFICGDKHFVANHVKHMISHTSVCPVCNTNLETPYMLNLHMKSHSRTCKMCTKLVAYTKIIDHEKMHQREGKDVDKEEEDISFDEDDSDHKKMNASNTVRMQSCFVPNCKNTSRNSLKTFLHVPKVKLKEWFKAVGRTRVTNMQASFWCCEDHFDMQKDCENWIKHKLMKSKIRMRSGVVPHKNLGIDSNSIKKEKEASDGGIVEKIEEEKSVPLLRRDGTTLESETSESDSDESVHFSMSQNRTNNKEILQKLRSHSLREKKDDNSKTTPSRTVTNLHFTRKTEKLPEFYSDFLNESSSSIQKTTQDRRKAIPQRKRKIKTDKDEHISEGNCVVIQKDIDEIMENREVEDDNINLNTEIDDYRIGEEKLNSKDIINNTNVSEMKVSKSKKRKKMEVDILDLEDLTETRVLRTRPKKSTEENKTGKFETCETPIQWKFRGLNELLHQNQ